MHGGLGVFLGAHGIMAHEMVREFHGVGVFTFELFAPGIKFKIALLSSVETRGLTNYMPVAKLRVNG